MKTLYSLTLSLVFICFSMNSIGQLELLSDQILYDGTPLYYEGGKIIMKSNDSESLSLYDVQSAEVIQDFPGEYIESFELNNKHYFICQDTSSLLYHYENGTLVGLQLADSFTGHVFLPQSNMDSNLVGMSTENGVVITDGTEEFMELVELDSPCRGWSSYEGNLIVYTASKYYFLESDYSISFSENFPDGYEPFVNSAYWFEVVISRVESLDMRVFDMWNEEMSEIMTPQAFFGFPTFNPENVIPSRVQDDLLVFQWNAYQIGNFYVNEPHQIASLSINSAIGYYDPFYANAHIRQQELPSFIGNSMGGAIAFGWYSQAGIEPYLIRSDTVKVVKDIYKGHGPSIELEATNSYPNDLHDFSYTEKNGMIYFSATHPSTGREIWRTDGTKGGTRQLVDIELGSRGLEEVTFIRTNSNSPNIAFSAHGKNGYLGLFLLSEDVTPVEIEELDSVNEWSSTFGLSDVGPVFGSSNHLTNPDLFPAKDGSVAFINAPMHMITNWLSYNGYGYTQESEFGNRDGALHIIRENGDVELLRNVFFENESFVPIMGRDYDSGKIVLCYAHQPGHDGYYGFGAGYLEDGILLLGLNEEGVKVWHKFFSSNANTKVRSIEYIDNEILLFGEFEGELSLSSDVSIITDSPKTGFVAKLDSLGEPIWLTPFTSSDQNIGDANYEFEVDKADSRILTFQGGIGYSTADSCDGEDYSGTVRCLDLQAGGILWESEFGCSNQFRITDLAITTRNDVWLTGYARGSMALTDNPLKLEIEPHPGNCSLSGFLINFGANGSLLDFEWDIDHGRQKILQDVETVMNGMYVLSLVVEEDSIRYHNTGKYSSYSVQLDTRSLNGRLLDSWIMPTGLREVEDYRSHKLSMALHPNDGVYLGFQNMYNGLVDNFNAIPSLGMFHKYFLVQRRETPLISNLLFESLNENGEQFLFPNPVNTGQYVNLLLRESDLEKFENLIFYDNTGRQVFSYQLADDLLEQRVRIPNDLSDGLYVVRLEGKELKTMKLIVRRW